MKLCDNAKLMNRKETLRYLGYGKQQPTEDILDILEECEIELKEIMQPDYTFLTTKIQRTKEGILTQQGGILLTGNSILKHLAGCDRAVLNCCTLGKAVDDKIEEVQKKDMLKALLLDATANAVIEEVRRFVEDLVAKNYPSDEVIWQFGVGYGDLPLSLQPKLLELLQTKEKIGVCVNSRLLLIPLKSVSGIMGLRKKNCGDIYRKLPD